MTIEVNGIFFPSESFFLIDIIKNKILNDVKKLMYNIIVCQEIIIGFILSRMI